MNLIPNHYYSTSSNAEKKIFDLLRNIKSDTAVFHSLNLPDHIANQRTGEIDFLLVSERGIFVLEIKGGRLSCEQGIWKTIDKNNIEHNLNRSPFRQAEEAMHTLEQKIYGHFPQIADKKCLFGYGVITPDCCANIISEEWSAELYADQIKIRDFEKWLNELADYWYSKTPYVPALSQKELKELRAFLRPDFEAGVNLFAESQDVNAKICQFTEEQMLFLDAIDFNDRVLVNGGAGTGKTFLGLELAKRISSNGGNIGYICYSHWLKNFLNSFNIPNVYATTIKDISQTLRREMLEQFDAIIIDEGQDLLNLAALDQLDHVLAGGLRDGKWYFFYDPNYQSNLIGSYEKEAEELLLSYEPMRISLRKNCRNTNQILKKLQELTGVDSIESRDIDGPAVMTFGQDVNIQDFLVNFLTNNPEFSAQDIVILGPKKFIESSAYHCRDGRIRIRELDAFAGQNSYYGVGYATIADYKGLENTAIVLIDLNRVNLENRRNYLYVGVTRARALLIIQQ